MTEEQLKGRTPPKSEEAERALLGALLLDPERVADVCEVVQQEDFFDKRHGSIFECLRMLSERGSPIDFVSVGEALKAQEKFHEVGGASYLIELADGVTSSAHASYHANIVADTAALRRLIRESTSIVTEAYNTRPDGETWRAL